jgi:Tol biopolymer transport system component
MSTSRRFAAPPSVATTIFAAGLLVAVTAGAPAVVGASPDPYPFAIADGEQWIAYEWVYDSDGVSDNENGVYLVRPDGRDKHLLLSAPMGHPDWSPDGKRIAVDTEPEDGEEIWILDADGTDVRVVTCDGASCGPVAAPAWSPDGRQLAFQRAAPREPGQDYDRVAIVVVDLATGATRVVAVSPAAGAEYVEYVGPRWSPDGTQIVFTVMRYPVPPTDENILGSSIAIVDADGPRPPRPAS